MIDYVSDQLNLFPSYRLIYLNKLPVVIVIFTSLIPVHLSVLFSLTSVPQSCWNALSSINGDYNGFLVGSLYRLAHLTRYLNKLWLLLLLKSPMTFWLTNGLSPHLSSCLKHLTLSTTLPETLPRNHSFIYLFFQQMYREHLLYIRQCSRHWGYCDEQGRKPLSF